MDKYQVTDPKGFTFGGEKLAKGAKLDAENKSAIIQTALHFRQIEKAPADPPSKKEKAPADPLA